MVTLIDTTTAKVISELITANDAVDSSNYPLIYTGADQTAQDASKAGDIFVTAAGAIFIAKGTTGSTDWVPIITP